jgi:murein DD-endopeptidase MepM/ murein hydrolase activator NlpD
VLLPGVDYGSIEAAFGNARGRPHEGQDMFAPAGTPVVAPAEGTVIDGGYDGGRGNWLSIYDPERKLTYSYFHLVDAAEVATGDKVKAGERVGQVGCTGSCYGDHLHFEVRDGEDPYATAIDPMPYLTKWKPLEN